jgi:hypothetical protein
LVVIAIAGLGRRAAIPATNFDDAATQQWFAAGEADLGDARPDEDPDEPHQLVVAEHLWLRDPGQPLGRHMQ